MNDNYVPWSSDNRDWQDHLNNERIERRVHDDGRTEYVRVKEHGNRIDGYTVKQSFAETGASEQEQALLAELWYTQKELRQTQHELERLAYIVEEMQQRIMHEVLHGIQDISYDIGDLVRELHDHTRKSHAMLIIGNKEDKKDESDIS